MPPSHFDNMKLILSSAACGVRFDTGCLLITGRIVKWMCPNSARWQKDVISYACRVAAWELANSFQRHMRQRLSNLSWMVLQMLESSCTHP
ncbi:hypothetical protein EVAR_103265_1 [Eumeta japonica]|uniref:Uncharacterized protein n=1 Tax=Eumeta variegata TaxID=151549 RepID=A0A4C1YBE6_EUMVA|nr:hypothetical protein EVAR_103265_1 [Eumeta japonica]